MDASKRGCELHMHASSSRGGKCGCTAWTDGRVPSKQTDAGKCDRRVWPASVAGERQAAPLSAVTATEALACGHMQR
eukprot:321764-Chlamydomonas_euryale.AAC.4